MKIGLMAVSLVILVVLLFGTYQAFSRTAVTEETVALDYQHMSRFDYTAYMEPSYVYGLSPVVTTDSKYPASLVNDIDMTYSFHSDENAIREVRVDAVIDSTGVWEKTVPLVAAETRSGNFTISFTVTPEYFRELAQTIDEEIGVRLSSNLNLTIVTGVSSSGEGNEIIPQTISHTLPMRLSESFIEIDGDLVHRHGDSYGKYDYTIHLEPNTLYDSTTMHSPDVSEETATVVLGPEDTVFLKLLDGMVFSFSHWLQAGEQVTLLEEEVEVSAIIEIPGKWSKEIELVPATEINGLADVSFPLDLDELTGILDIVQQETGVSLSTRNLTVSAKVSTLAQTDFGLINDEYTHSLVADLTGGILNWSGDLDNTEPMSIETGEIIERTEKYLGLPVIVARILLSSLAIITLILVGYSLVMYFRTRSERPEDAGKITEKVLNKYRGIVVDTRTMPVTVPTDTIVQLESLDDLIKIAQGLLKPVLHKEEQTKHIYYVLDNATRYEYVIAKEVIS